MRDYLSKAVVKSNVVNIAKQEEGDRGNSGGQLAVRGGWGWGASKPWESGTKFGRNLFQQQQ